MAVSGSDLEALRKARATVDDVFGLVRSDSFYERPIPGRHRIIFYVGHLEAFDHNLLRDAVNLPEFDRDLEQLFAFGIDPDSGALPTDQPSDWPKIPEVYAYRDRVRREVDARWEDVPEVLRRVALEHRLMHAETLAYMLHNLPHDRLVRPGGVEAVTANDPVENEAVEVLGGTVTLGRHCSEGFGWDNEFPRLHTTVDSFRINRWKVSNGEYLALVRAGAPPPFFWTERDGRYFLRRMFDEIPLPLDWPVYVTQEEAAAYAAWHGARLPTEAEWHLAAEGSDVSGGNFDARRFDPEPVSANRASASRCGVEDLYGNGWEWTSTLFRPFPGFEAFPFYPGYSASFFDDDHYVLKGASPRTDGVFTRRSFRNWFRKDYPYVFAAFRCIHNKQ